MNAPDQIRAKGGMNSAVACNAVFSLKLSAAQHDIEVALARGRGPCVPRVAGAVIHDRNLARGKCHAQLIFDFLPYGHIT